MATNATAGGKITPESVQSQLHLNPQQKAQLERIVLAGQKVMFSRQSHKLMLDQLNGPGPIDVKLGQGIAGLIGLLMQESKNSLPPNLLIPAGMVLLAHAARFLAESGQPVSDQDIANAMNVMVTAVLNAFGLDADKVAARAGGAKPAPASKPGARQ